MIDHGLDREVEQHDALDRFERDLRCVRVYWLVLLSLCFVMAVWKAWTT